MIRLDANQQPYAVIKTGVRIFSDGRNPKDSPSLAVTRREARTMRRRRDRLLKRKARMMSTLIELLRLGSSLSQSTCDKTTRNCFQRSNFWSASRIAVKLGHGKT